MRSSLLRPANWLVVLFGIASVIFAANVVFFPNPAMAQVAPLPGPKSCPHGSSTDYKESLAALKAKVIVLEGDDFAAFTHDLDILLVMGPAPDYIQSIGFTDPATLGKDVPFVTVFFFDKNGCTLGTKDWPKKIVIAGLDHSAPPAKTMGELTQTQKVISDMIMSIGRNLG